MDQYSPDIVELEDGHYFTLDPLGDPWETELVDEDVDGKPTVAGETNRTFQTTRPPRYIH
jgi:hypothetical protein